jgi:hypothetical protein
MRVLPNLARHLGSALVAGALLLSAASAQTCTTSITGIVYAPNGVDPLPNVLVYVPTTAVQPFPAGVSSCQAEQSLVTGNPLVRTVTAADGTFTLTNPGLAGSNIPLVIQAGKWRRQVTVPTVLACETNPFSTQMPQTHLQGDIPQIAVVTGNADSLECVLRKIGIADTEFSNPASPVSASTGRVNLYVGTGQQSATNTENDGGAEIDANTPYENVLMQNQTTLNSYDLVMFACQGTSTDYTVTGATQSNLIDYANIGGRVFGTHFAYVWLDDDPPFSTTAQWDINQAYPASTTALINTTFPDGKILADWLQDIQATTTYGQITVATPRKDQDGVNPPTQTWLTLREADNAVMQFTFDTPIQTAGVPTLSVTFANSPAAAFLQGDPADTIQVNVTNNSSSAADSSLTLSAVMNPDLTVTSIAGTNANTGWACALATLTCNRTTPLNPGITDPITLTVSVAATAVLGSKTLTTITVAGGGLAGSNQCGRVLFTEYHVETEPGSVRQVPFPTECPAGAMSAQEKLLEYSLFDLSNFVAATYVDTGLIQDTTTTTLTGVVSTIFYGQIIADIAVETTVGNNGEALDGGILSFYINGVDTCDLPADQGGTCPATTGAGYDVGTYQVQSCYQGDTEFQASCSPLYTVVIVPDPTSTTLTSSPNPSLFGQPVTLTATVADQYATARGPVIFYDGSTPIGTSAVNAQAVATYTAALLIPGTHTITACLQASLDFLASVPCGTVTQVVAIGNTPQNTITLLVSSSNPSIFGQNVTFSAAVATTGSFPVIPSGNIAFYDGTTQLFATTLDSHGDATFSISTLAIGTHPITAVYAGNTTLAPSTSAPLQQVVLASLTPAGKAFLMTVTPTSLSVGVGNTGAITVTILDLPPFNQPVQLSCGYLPNEATCSFGQSLIPAGGATTTLTITPAAPHACSTSTPDFIAPNSLGSNLLLLLLSTLGLWLTRKRRRIFTALTLAFALCLLPMLSGCSSRCTDFGTQPATYTFTVIGTALPATTGTSSTEVETQAVTLKVHL